MPSYIRYALGVGFLTIFGTLLTIVITTPQALGSFGTLVLMGAGALCFLGAGYMFVTGWLVRSAEAHSVPPSVPVVVVYTLRIERLQIGNRVAYVATESLSYYIPRLPVPPQ